MTTIDELVELLVKVRLRSQPVIAVVGSGISAPQIPLMSEIIEHTCDVFNSKEFCDDPVLVRQSEYRTLDGLKKLFREDPDPILRDAKCWRCGVVPWLQGRELNAKHGKQHKALMQLLRQNLLRAIVTTNWDCLLEDSVKKPSETTTSNAGSDYLILRDPQIIEKWIQQPRALPALVKIHGDVRESRCPRGHVTIQDRKNSKTVTHCSHCGEPTTQRILLPDSARRLSREMIKFFRGTENRQNGNKGAPGGVSEDRPVERFDRLGCILVIGFSGRFDSHLQSLISEWGKCGCLVAIIDIDPYHAFSGTEKLITGKAEELVPRLALKWLKATRSRRRSGFRNIPPLEFVRSEERFDSLFGRIPITDLESKILSHAEFSRLRSIKQLGQKSRFYPSADHSRFEHSVASLKVIDELYCGLVEAVARERKSHLNRHVLAGYYPTSEERQLIRLATLFHDFGHYAVLETMPS